MIRIVSDHPDHEDMDEWELCIFDESNPSETVQEIHAIPFAQALLEASEFVLKNKNLQLRVVVMRIC